MKTLKLKSIVSVILLVMIAWACQNNTKDTESNLYTNAHKVTVKEVIQASSYTYLNVEENNEIYWIAVNKGAYEVGNVLYYDNGMEMNNFESKDLQRTFESIFFVQDITDQPRLPGEETQPSMSQGQPQKPTLEKLDINIEPADDGISISTLYADKDNYKDKIVKIKGQVTKFNPNIMGKNWIHIQDGSEHNGSFDLTITTIQTVNVGDVVTFEGKIFLDKDFGAGYAYDLIMEEAIKVDSI
jgi:hypothetical protein